MNFKDFTGFHCHTTFKTIQQIKSRIKEEKEDEYSNSVAKIQVDLCNVLCGRYSKKCFTQIYKAMCGDAIFVSQIWQPEAGKNICHRVFYKEPVLVF